MKTLISAALIGTAAVCLSSPCGTPVHDWPSGSSHAVFTDGSRFFYGAGSALVMAEADQQGELVILGHSRPQTRPAVDVAVNGAHALVATHGRVSVLDFGDPGPPTKIGETYVPGTMESIRSAGTVAVAHWNDSDYATYYIEALEIISITDPSQPDTVGRIDPPGYSGTLQMIPGWLFYLVDDLLHVYDLSFPSLPILAARNVQLGSHELLAVHENTLVMSTDIGLKFVDVSEPSVPLVRAVYQPAASVEHALWVNDSLLLVAGDSLEIVNMSSPTPTRSALVEGVFPDGVQDMAATLGRCVLIEGDPDWPLNQHLRVVDISNPSAPEVGPVIALPSVIRDLAVSPGRIGALTARALWLLDREPDGSTTERLAARLDGYPDQMNLQNEMAYLGETQWNSATNRYSYKFKVWDLAAGDEAEVIAEIDLDSDATHANIQSIQIAGDDWVAVALPSASSDRLAAVPERRWRGEV
jgi:hypothetical protein